MYNVKADNLFAAREAAKMAKIRYDALKKKALIDVCQHIKESDKPYFTVREISLLSDLSPAEIGNNLCRASKMTRDMDKPSHFIKPVHHYYIEVDKNGNPLFPGCILTRKVRESVLSYNDYREVMYAD